MDEKDKKQLTVHLVQLCKELNLDVVLRPLQAQEILNEDHVQLIRGMPTQSRGREELITILRTRGPNAFSALCEALQKDEGQKHLAVLLRNRRATGAAGVTKRVDAAEINQQKLESFCNEVVRDGALRKLDPVDFAARLKLDGIINDREYERITRRLDSIDERKVNVLPLKSPVTVISAFEKLSEEYGYSRLEEIVQKYV